MTALKTQENDASVDKFLAGIEDDQKRSDCLSVLDLMKDLTGEPAVMWGKAMVGFGKSCLYGKKFKDLHVPTLMKLIKKAYSSPAIAGATIDPR